MDLSTFLYGLLVVSFSDRTNAYQERVLENDSVCSMSFSTNNLELIGREDQSALLIKDSRYFQQWTGKHEFNCKFSVTSPLELGVVAVIQQMSFRRNAADCIDYVQFRRAEKTLQFLDINIKIKSSNDWSPKICGTLNKYGFDSYNDDSSSKSYNMDDSLTQHSFVSNSGIEVKIHIGNKSLEAGETLRFEIVLTAYQECNYDNGRWKSCGSRTCIFKDFFHDGYINCPYQSCIDENGCHLRSPGNKNGGDRFNTSFGTKIMAGTVAGLFTMFVAFIAFLWLFRHCGTAICCIGHPNSHPHSSEMQPVPHLDTMAVLPTAQQDVVASGADVRTADKDLPPSYESLFPSK